MAAVNLVTSLSESLPASPVLTFLEAMFEKRLLLVSTDKSAIDRCTTDKLAPRCAMCTFGVFFSLKQNEVEQEGLSCQGEQQF